jgi:hypothetical protein
MPRGSAPGERRGGRRKGTPNKSTQIAGRDLKALAQEYTDEAVLSLASIMRTKGATDSARVKASEILLAYGHGRPTQKIDLDAKLTLEQLVTASLAQREEPE